MSKTGEVYADGNKLNYSAATSTNYSKLNDAAMVEGIPIATYIPDFVKVVAPSNLPEGYQFTVLANSVRLIVAVPEGGVKDGQQFNAKVIGEDMSSSSGRNLGENSIPVGSWRDGICDCCQLGICHPHVWMAWFCLPIALGQVMTRLNLDWLGNSMEQHPSSFSAFKVLWFHVFFGCFLILLLGYLDLLLHRLLGVTKQRAMIMAIVHRHIRIRAGLLILLFLHSVMESHWHMGCFF